MKTASEAVERIAGRIQTIRGQRVLLDVDLAALYGVSTKQFNQAVKRNNSRFPLEFMFRLTPAEFENLRSQFVTSSSGWGGRRSVPQAFTEHGALMAATILNTARERWKYQCTSCVPSCNCETCLLPAKSCRTA